MDCLLANGREGIGYRVACIAAMRDPKTTPTAAAFAPPAASAAGIFGACAFLAAVHEHSKIEPVMIMLKRETGGGLIFPPDPFDWINRKLITELALNGNRQNKDGASKRVPISRDVAAATINPHRLAALTWAVVGHAGGAPGRSRDLAALNPVLLRLTAD
jgi:hypothetical protein